MQELVGDVVERLKLAVGQRLKRLELLRLDALLHRVLEQSRLVRGQADADERSLQLSDCTSVHAAFLPGRDREKRLYA